MDAIATPLWQMRILQNWIKTVMIKEISDENDNVSQIGQTSLDLGKWERNRVSRLLGIERSDEEVELANKRWLLKNSPYPATFIKYNIEDNMNNEKIEPYFNQFDVLVSFGNDLDEHLFESQGNAHSILSNISKLLKNKGYFFGLSFDSSELWTRITKVFTSNRTSFQTQKELIHIDFPDISLLYNHPDDIYKESIEDSISSSNFGIRFYSFLENRRNTNYLIHIPTFINIAKKYNLYLVEMTNCVEFYQLQKSRWFEELKKMNVFMKPKNIILPEQRDALSLYTTFVFQKIE